jgi:hypothetical protein
LAIGIINLLGRRWVYSKIDAKNAELEKRVAALEQQLKTKTVSL